MNYTLVEILSYSVGLAAIIGLVRIKVIDKAYYPFILLLWLGLINEILNTVFINVYRNNAINSNIYVLAEAVLILIFFKRLKLFANRVYIFYLFMVSLIVLWLWENLIYSDIWHFGSYYRIVYSFCVVLLSISMINKLVLWEKQRISRNAAFLIMTGFIIFFTYKVLIEIFYLYGINGSELFGVSLYRIITYINVLVNLLFAISILWIPRKREFTLR